MRLKKDTGMSGLCSLDHPVPAIYQKNVGKKKQLEAVEGWNKPRSITTIQFWLQWNGVT